MKNQIFVSLIAGAIIGSLVTFFSTRRSDDRLLPIVATKASTNILEKGDGMGSVDPLDEVAGMHLQVDVIAAEVLPDESRSVRRINMSDCFERDTRISNWYLGMQGIVRCLKIQTRHKFKPVAKMSAGPVEILKEQAAFMKKFLAETD